MTQPDGNSCGASVDIPRRRADDRRMDSRLALVEKHLGVVRSEVANLRANTATREDLASVRENLASLQANCATKEDLATAKTELYIAMNAQTWRFVTWTTGVMGMLVAAVYFIARNVH